jgi:protein-disulfide isomerase
VSNRTRRAQLQAQRLAALQAQRRRRRLVVGLAVGLAVVLVVLVVWLVNRRGQPTPGGSVAPTQTSPGQRGIVVNPEVTAPAHELIIYSDYQCDWCRRWEVAMEPVLQEAVAGGQTRLEIRNRTFLDGGGHDGWSRPAAIAASCVATAAPSQFLAYHVAVLEEQGNFSDALLRDQLPARVGLSSAARSQVVQCYDSVATGQFVDQVEEAAAQDFNDLGIRGTPAFLLDGEQMSEAWWDASASGPDLSAVRRSLGLS